MQKRDGPSPSRRAVAKLHAAVAASPSIAGPNACPAPNPGATTTAGVRKRKAPAAAARKPRKPQHQGTIQISVHYGHREEFHHVSGDDLGESAHVIAELPPQPQSMSLVDLQLWIFKLFRLHPETQDLAIKGFLKQWYSEFGYPEFDDFDPDHYLEYCHWEPRYFLTDKCWSSFANKIKRRNVMQKFMLYVDSSEIKHYDVLLKAVNDDYSQLATVVLPGTKCLGSGHFRFIRLVEDLAMTATEIAAYLTDNYSQQFSPREAWRARQKALEREFGTFYDSHDLAPRLLKDIACKNPGGFVDIQDSEVAGCKDFRVLHRIFWAFAQCLQAFHNCRPVLCVKGTPLCGKYQGVLLTAVALDANDCSILVACAIVEGETKESWLWFLRNLERAVVKRSGVCIIHDYKRELINAVEDLLNYPQRPDIWKDLQSRWCMEHLAENFLVYFGNEKLMTMFKKLCQQKRLNKFGKIWKELDELTAKYMLEKEGRASGVMQQESVEHDEAELETQSPCNQPDSVEDGEEGDHADDSKRKITKFSDWIRLKPMEKWSLLHDRKGARYGIMGTSTADVYQHDPVLKGITCLPLSAIVEVTFQRTVECFKNKSAAANNAIGNPSMNFPEHVQDDMNSKMQKAQMHRVICMDTKDRNVLGEKGVGNFTVQSRQKKVIVHLNLEYTCIRKSVKCSCNKPQLLRKPCSHVIAVCCQIGVSTSTYMSPYYSLSYLGSTWSGEFSQYKTSRNYRNIMPSECETPTWIPDKKLECGLPVFLTSDCVQTAVDEEEQQCSIESGSIADNQGTQTHSEEPSQV